MNATDIKFSQRDKKKKKHEAKEKRNKFQNFVESSDGGTRKVKTKPYKRVRRSLQDWLDETDYE